jgi:putative transcriptional regulator
VQEFESHSFGLAGSVLLAHPSLRDPHFQETVVFVSMHDAEDGAFGMILNRPSGKRLAELMPKRDLGILAMAPVYFGGPVGTEQLLLTAFRWEAEEGVWSWRHNLTIESAAEAVQEEGAIIRVFAGYSGWSKGQLETEVKRGTWVIHQPAEGLLEPRTGNGKSEWVQLVRQHGPVFEFLTATPKSLGLN